MRVVVPLYEEEVHLLTRQDNKCRVNLRSRRVKLKRQLSNSGCWEGNTWGYDRNGIWVDNGCSGVFKRKNWSNPLVISKICFLTERDNRKHSILTLFSLEKPILCHQEESPGVNQYCRDSHEHYQNNHRYSTKILDILIIW